MMASTPEIGAVVVGGGIAGLAAALALQRQVSEVLVVDSSDRPGGVMRTDHVAGYVVERGPNTFQAKAPMLAALREHGLDDELLRAEPESKRRFIVCEGQLVAVPMSPLGFLRTPLLTAGGRRSTGSTTATSGPATSAATARRWATEDVRRSDNVLDDDPGCGGRRRRRPADLRRAL